MSALGRLPAIVAALAAAAPACTGATADGRSRAALPPLAPAAPAPSAPAAPAPSAPAAPASSTHARSGAPHTGARVGNDRSAAIGAGAAAAQAPARAFPTACSADAGCGYDPASGRCGADPRLNRQPPVTDQGIVCYCDAGACALLRVLPVPCEGDHDCAVAREPRPHPTRATRDRPHEKGRPCRDFTMSTTCERTNICTLHRHACPARE
ncbi:hypothetical protein WMF31_04245 [Sorangium sp. So ce1036]|uniref:hypothetical protein n=1 Tax=Sorangium sp. So ce1036 TaxID=3133328 RepID=UPI003F08F80C